MRRDARLDALRGLCLVDVVLVHLSFDGVGFPWRFDELVRHYTRFAAGGFLLLAGVTVATVFGPRFSRGADGRREVARRLRRRAIELVAITIALELVFTLVHRLRAPRWGWPAGPGTRDILLLRAPGALGGIFLLYTLLLLATPLLLRARRRFGAWPVALASALLYGAAYRDPATFHWPRNDFPVAFWQPLFVAGLLAGHGLLDRLQRTRSSTRRWAIAAAAAFAVVFALNHGPAFGFDLPGRLLPADFFEKIPLQPGALLWYLAAVDLVLALVGLVWPALEGGAIAASLALLGRHSLLVYGAHVFTAVPVLEACWRSPAPGALALALAALDLGALLLLCLAVERRERPGPVVAAAAASPGPLAATGAAELHPRGAALPAPGGQPSQKLK